MKYLLDANVVAAAIKGRLPVVLRLNELKPHDVAISVVSRVEAEASLRAQPRAQTKFGKLLREFISQVRVLEFGDAESMVAVNLAVQLRAENETLSGFDLIVAATALTHQLTLVTERPAAFLHVTNLETENWK